MMTVNPSFDDAEQTWIGLKSVPLYVHSKLRAVNFAFVCSKTESAQNFTNMVAWHIWKTSAQKGQK